MQLLRGHRDVMQVWGAGKDTANSHKEMMEVFKSCSDLFCVMKDLMNPFVSREGWKKQVAAQ